MHDKSPVASEGSYIRVLVLGTIEVSGVPPNRTMPSPTLYGGPATRSNLYRSEQTNPPLGNKVIARN